MTTDKRELSAWEQSLAEKLTAAVGNRLDQFLRTLERTFRERVDALYTVGAVDAETADKIELALFESVAAAAGPTAKSIQHESGSDEANEERD